MEPLFEAKATYNDRLETFNIFRIEPEKYHAQMVLNENDNFITPVNITVFKKDGEWQTEDRSYSDLAATLGAEIDVFNFGYGDLLGRIGVS